jgi:HEAT repeats
MLFKKKTVVIAAVFFALGASLSSAQPGSKGKSTNPSEVEMLRSEVARLRADLDAALREIAAMKLAMNGGKAAPEEGQLFRGRSARHWLEQLKDADDKTREAAIEAIGALARKDKKLIPVLLDALKNDPSYLVTTPAANALVAIGPEVLPALIEIAKDKTQATGRFRAIEAIGYLGPRAKTAVPLLAKSLADADSAVLRASIRAIGMIGPDAKDAIPDLVNALGDCNAEAGKPGSRFGTSPLSINVMILDALFVLDPQLNEVVVRPRASSPFGDAGLGGLGGKGGKAGGGKKGVATPNDTIDTWISIHETLVKRYRKTK